MSRERHWTDLMADLKDGCAIYGDCCTARMWRPQGGGGVMIWGGIIGDKLVGLIRVPQD